MKKIWHTVLAVLESLGRARAASELARSGRYKEARELFEKDIEVHP
jgi:hypothetical protein